MPRTHCPHCGAALPVRALACPDCGSDESTGWAPEEKIHEAAWADSDDENYRDVIRSLPGGGRATAGKSPRDIVLAILVVIALAAFILTFVF